MAWWLEEINIGGSQGPTYQVVQGSTRPDPSLIITGEHTSVKVTGPYSSNAAAQKAIPAGAHTGPYTPGFAGQATPQAPSVPGIGSGVPWLRIGEILLGLALIAVGIAKMTDSVKIATKIAGYMK